MPHKTARFHRYVADTLIICIIEKRKQSTYQVPTSSSQMQSLHLHPTIPTQPKIGNSQYSRLTPKVKEERTAILMLRLNTLKCKLCFLSLSNIDVADLYQKAVNYFLLNSWCFSCPTCGMQQGSWIRYGTYSRWVITYSAVTGTVQTQLKIQRMLCRHCRSGGELHTHALLADFIVPYRQYSIQFILHFLMLYYTHQKSVEEICAEARISPTQLYEWDRTITKNREIWSGILTFEQE